MNKLTFYEGLQLKEVLKIVAKNCSFEASYNALLAEDIIFNPLHIGRKIAMTKEAMEILKKEYVVDFGGIEDVRDLLTKAKKGQMLMAVELLAVLRFHNHCRRLKTVFNKIPLIDELSEYVDALVLDNKVFAYIDTIVDNNGKIQRNASLQLSKLYEKDELLLSELNTKAHDFMDKHGNSLQEEAVYFRDDRMAFLLKNSDKNKYDGYIHGQSVSGLAAYVEPKEFVNLNNMRDEVSEAQKQEIIRILKQASSMVAGCANIYIYNFETLLVLDGIFAKAKYGVDNLAILADFVLDRHLYLQNIAHPLINPLKVVRNTYELYPDKDGILITGANTGGKTVSLKVIGLSVLLSYLGIPLLADRACIPFYDGLFIDIDDNQSLESSLSTFSSQLVKLNTLLHSISANSLVLIDELGNGTDPKQAQALSIAIVEKILSLKCNFVLTTHFEDLKKYALNNPRILVSSVSFDNEKLVPTYHYVENSLGSSNALEIASHYIEDETIIARAHDYLKENENKEEQLLHQLEQKINENEKLQDELTILIKENKRLQNDLDTKLARFVENKEDLLLKYEEELNAFIEGKIVEVKEIMAAWNKNRKNPEVLKALDNLKIAEKEDEGKEDLSLAVGDNVRLKDSEQIGTVIAVNGKQVEVSINGLRIKTKLNALTKMPKKQTPKTYQPKVRHKRVERELVLVGERAEEAIRIMEKYLDNAYAANMSSVRIVHGIGTGILRKAIHERLAKMKHVKNYHLADYYDGGSAVTIVEF